MLTNPKHEAFAQAVAAGSTGGAAYRTHVSPKATEKSARECASRLLKAGSPVAARIAELKGEVAEVADAAFLFTKADLLRWYLSALQTPVSEIDEQHPLCQEYTVSSTGAVKVKMLSKLDAAKQIAALCGWNTADEEDKKTTDGLTELLTALRKR